MTNLQEALKALQKLGGEDFLAISEWMKGKGRKKLRDLGATDQDIGPARFDVDLLDDGPLG